MKKICLIRTGGTIGSVCEAGVVGLGGSGIDLLLADCDAEFCEGARLNILSENMGKADLFEIYKAVLAVDTSAVSGIIITHGTDTLAYTACYLALMFRDISVPVVLVSANFPLGDARSNGADNFDFAVEFIKNASCGGVFVSYKNPGEDCRIMRGEAVLQCVGKAGYFYFDEGLPLVCDMLSQLDFAKIDPRLPKNVLNIPAVSFCDYDLYSVENCDVVVCESFHSGTVKTIGKGNINGLIARAKAKNIPVIITCMSNGDIYESVKAIDDLGNVVFLGCSFEMGNVLGASVEFGG